MSVLNFWNTKQIRIPNYVKTFSKPMHKNSLCIVCGEHGANHKMFFRDFEVKHFYRWCFKDACKKEISDRFNGGVKDV